MNDRDPAMAMVRGLLGAAVGGAVGFFAFRWILSQGFYAMIIPGAALGYGFSLATPHRSRLNGIICAVLAAGLSIFAEWKTGPFVVDPSFGFFIMHLHELPMISLLMMAAGSVLAYWSTTGESRPAGRTEEERAAEE